MPTLFNKYASIVLSLLLLNFNGSISAANQKDSEENNNQQISRIPVTVVVTEVIDVEKKVRVQGDIDTSTQPTIAAEVAAKVDAMLIGEGSTVRAGDTLAILDDEPFQIAKEKALADIQRIQALIHNQQRLVQRNRKLYREKLLSQTKLDDSETALSLSEADLIVVKARLKDTEYKLRHVKVVSPIDAVVQTKLVSTGDYLKVGKGIYKLVSLKDIYARLFFPETLAGVVKTPTAVTLYHGLEKIEASLDKFRPMLEKGNRAIHGIVIFDNKLNWKPGYSVIGEVSLEIHKDAIMVPLQSVVRRPKGNVVYVIKNQRAEEFEVTTGLIQGAQIEILTGLEPNQTIALDGAPYLSDGAAVSIKQNDSILNAEQAQ